MPVLNDADALYLDGPVDAVYLGAEKVWPSWSPAKLSDLVTWLDASQLPLADGAAVSPWPNLSGGVAPTIVGTPAPKMETNALNGLPVVRFTYAQGRLRSAWPYPIYNYTLLYVVRWVGPNVGRAFSVQYPPSNLLVGMHTSQPDTFYDNGTWLTPGTGWNWWTPGPGPWRMYEADSQSGLGARFLIDGTVIAGSPTNGTGGFTSGWGLSGYDATGDPETLDIEVAELVLYSRKLADVERQQVENYLRTKWGL